MKIDITPSFSCLYDGKQALPLKISEAVSSDSDRTVATAVYDFGNGVTVTNICTRYTAFDSVEWVNCWENKGTMPSGIVSELLDCDVTLPFPKDEPLPYTAYMPDPEKCMQLIAPKGSTWECDEFAAPGMDEISSNSYYNLFFPGQKKAFATSGGRSSEAHAPFFQIHRQDMGYIVAVGWTGQWNTSLERTGDGVSFCSGIEGTGFRILPGESFRTSSVLIMPYEGRKIDGNNRWRRLLKAHYSLIGKEGRDVLPPFCTGIWGGMQSEEAVRRIDAIGREGLPFTHIWMDAGWYGMSTKDSPDEFEGDWGAYTGDWRVNPTHHPDGLQDVVKSIRDSGKKFVLWFEPERVICGVPVTKEHPEYFLGEKREGSNVLLNLGDPDAWQYCFSTLKELIGQLQVSVYRQDFNMSPLSYFRNNDAEDRKGMTEILHINGMYRLWDKLLETFPHLIIDNCASGGRRIDIETLRRSIPLWRSDAQCPANFPEKLTQMHNASFGLWMPYSGTGAGRACDTYRFRSSYAPALTTNYAYSARDPFGEDREKLEWIRRMGAEYLRVQPYLSCDMYPLTEPSYKEDVWSAIQYNRPEENDGVLLICRRSKAPYEQAVFPLYGLDDEKQYTFSDVDTGETATLTGAELKTHGYPVTISEQRSAKVIMYQAK